MAHVIVQVNGRPYTMQCPEGEEEHLRELAQLLDNEVQRVKSSVGNVGDIRMLVMAGLMVADRLSEAIRRIELLEEQVMGLRNDHSTSEAEMRLLEQEYSERLAIASQRLELIAREINK
jgi:cell division protein ZapA